MLRKGEREFRERRSLIKGKDGWIGGNGSVVLKELRGFEVAAMVGNT